MRDGKELIQNEGEEAVEGSRGNLGRCVGEKRRETEEGRKEVDLGREGGRKGEPMVGVKFARLYDGAHKIEPTSFRQVLHKECSIRY